MQQCVLEELHMSSMIFCCFINLHTVDVSAYEEFMNKVDADFEMSGKGLCFFIVFEYDHVIPMIRKDVLIYFEKLRKIH